jgi:uncharacterized protein
VTVLAALVVGAASVVGGATGFATALIATPLLVLIGFDVPTAVVLILGTGLVSRLSALVAAWDLIDRRRVALLGLGSVPGAVAGTLTVAVVDVGALRVGVGIAVVLIGLYLLVPRRSGGGAPGALATGGVGVLGGFLSTSLSVNGPPVAVLLDRAGLPPTRFVADFAGYIVVTNTLALSVIALTTGFPDDLSWPAFGVLAVAAVIGNELGRALNRRVPHRLFRLVVTLLVIASGVVTATT